MSLYHCPHCGADLHASYSKDRPETLWNCGSRSFKHGDYYEFTQSEWCREQSAKAAECRQKEPT